MNKFSNISFPTQSGKTSKVLEIIQTFIVDEPNSIHIIFTQNMLDNTQQFFSRLVKKIGSSQKIGVIASNFCKFSKEVLKKENFVFAKNLKRIDFTNTKIVMMCKNYVRINSLIEIVDELSTNNITKSVYVYFDELHQSFDSVNKKKDPSRISNRELIDILHQKLIVKQIIGLSATPASLWDSSRGWDKIKQIKNGNDDNSDYYHIYEMNFKDVSEWQTCDYLANDISCIYAKYILDYYPEILSERARVFIPAMKYIISHNLMQDMILNMHWDCVVVKINGVNRTISYFKNKQSFDAKILTVIDTVKYSKENKEINETISDILSDCGLHHRPIVFTGKLCVSIGCTLVNPVIGNITSAIFHPGILNSSKDNIYQLIGRCSSKSKTWKTFKETTIYTTLHIYKIAIAMEKLAITICSNHSDEYFSENNYINLQDDIDVEIENIEQVNKCKINSLTK